MEEKTFLDFANAFPEAIVLLDTSGKILTINKKAKKILSLSRLDPIGQHLSQFVIIQKGSLKDSLRIWSRSRTPIPANIQWTSLPPDKAANIQCQAFLLQPSSDTESGKLVLRCVMGKSISRSFMELNQELKRYQAILQKLQASRNALKDEHEKALVTLHSIGDAVITTDKRGVVEYLNPIAEDLTGWSNEESQGEPLAIIFNIINETTRQPAPNPVIRCLKEGRIVGLANHTALISRDGTEHVIEDSAAPIRNHQDKILGSVLVFRDVTRDRLARRQLEYLAQHDTLTGLKNRFFFEQQLDRIVNIASRGQHHSALLYIDLDEFKIINDTAGHAAGDDLLVEVSSLLSARLRQGDVLARLGGDEFGIILENIMPDKLQATAESFNQVLQGFRYDWDGNHYGVTCSIGTTVIDKDTKSLAEAMRQADIACYVAKGDGRNRIHIYNKEDEHTASTLGEINILNNLRSALKHDGFILHFQPIIDIAINKVQSHEVLLRLKHSDGSLIRPGNFIAVAERYGLMPSIDHWVLSKSLQYLNEVGPKNPSHQLSVNISGASLGDGKIVKLIQSFAKKYPGCMEKLIIEVTETSAIMHIDKASMFIRELRNLGVRFALDDFGTGFSSFAYLKHLQVDYIKIDGTFIKDITKDPADQAMVRSINHIAHSLDKKTIAEFVEDKEILELLKTIGVDMAQGYFIGKPGPDI